MPNAAVPPRSRLADTCARVRAGGRRRALQACVVFGCAGAAACAHGQAKTLAEMPPLEMPAPPPRLVEVVEPPEEPVAAAPQVPSTAIAPPAPPAERRGAPRAPEPARVEPVPADAARPPDEPPRTQPPTTLQTTPTGREGEVERRIRVVIAQAVNHLSRVNYQALNANARNQYDTAKRFAVQAEEALQSRNLVFASNLADKAAALAGQLPTR